MNHLEMSLTRDSFHAWHGDRFAPYDVRVGMFDEVVFQDDDIENLECVCPHWVKFLGTSFSHPLRARILQEMFGYLMIADVSLNRLFVIDGSSGSGKTVVQNALHAVLGGDRVVETGFAKMASRHFELAGFMHAMAAIVADANAPLTPDQAVGAVSLMKSIVHGEEVAIDRKYQPQATRRLDSRFVIITNEVPLFLQQSAITRRTCWIRMELAEGVTPDPGLASRVVEEAAGIRIWALLGLLRLIGRVESLTQSVCLGSGGVFPEVYSADELAAVDAESEGDRGH